MRKTLSKLMSIGLIRKNTVRPIINRGFLMKARPASIVLTCARAFSTNDKITHNEALDKTGNVIRKFNSGVAVFPHADKKAKGGEDAYYVSDAFVAVADGVGGWAESGIDPAKYSKELCQNLKKNYENPPRAQMKNNPKEIFIVAAGDTKNIGSSTCCIAMLDPQQNKLHTVNLGDSGYMILRKEGNQLIKVFKSEEQTHQFNFPFQVGTGGDNPAKANIDEHEVKNNDIVILATDGLWDNLFEEQVIDCVRPFLRTQEELADPELVAEMIAKHAETFSLKKDHISPFAKRAREQYYDWRGGKADDITVVVSQIVLGDQAPPSIIYQGIDRDKKDDL